MSAEDRRETASLISHACPHVTKATAGSVAARSSSHNGYMAETTILTPEPRWPAALALLSVGGLHYALPPEFRVGPDWLVFGIVAVLVVPATIVHYWGNWRVSHYLGYAANAIVTLAVGVSLALLISRLPAHKDTPAQLLR